MKVLTMTLFERLGLLLVLAFLVTRIPGFRSLLDRELDLKTTGMHALIFGLFGIAGAQAGVVMEGETFFSSFWVFQLEDHQMLVGSSLVAMVIAGLLGGPVVGWGAGCIVSLYMFQLGGMGTFANILVHPLTGFLAGWTARFFSQERVIAPLKALFIGIFPPILQGALLLVFSSQPEVMIPLVDRIGLPLVVSNSVAIAIFTAMIRVALHEQEQEAAYATRRALAIAEEALPYLKKESQVEMADDIAELLFKELQVAAVSVTNRLEVLAHRGLGNDHHHRGDPLTSPLLQQAIQKGEVTIASVREEIRCPYPGCPLEAAIIVPIVQSGETSGLIQLYFRRSQQLGEVEVALAQGLCKLISNQLNAVSAEKLRLLIRDAELRNLQAQINPHFLFNTLHLISTLIRVHPDLARKTTVQLGNYMRYNLRLAAASLVPLEEERKHLDAYLEILRTRFADRLTLVCHMEDGVGRAMLPPSTIQPLVENSIQHGLKNAISGGKVEVEIRKVKRGIRIIVRDNGCGFPADILEQAGKSPVTSEKGSGIGLYNVNQRLIGLLGAESQLEVCNRRSGGSEISFLIPDQEPAEEGIK